MKLEDVVRMLKPKLTPEQRDKLREALKKAGYARKIKLAINLDDREVWEYRLHKVWWKGQTVIRDLPETQYYLRMRRKVEGSWEYMFFLLSGKPRPDEPFALYPEKDIDPEWYDYEGDIPPGERYNPNKRLTAKDEIIDKGKVYIDKESNKAEFRGKLLKGIYKLEGSPKNTWVFWKAAFIYQVYKGEAGYYLVTPDIILLLSGSPIIKEGKAIPAQPLEHLPGSLQLIFEGEGKRIRDDEHFIAWILHGPLEGYYWYSDRDGTFGKGASIG